MQIVDGVRHFSLLVWKDWILALVSSLGEKSGERAWKFCLFILGAAGAGYLDFLPLYVMVSLGAFIALAGFETRKEGELSAFSVFNAGFKQLLGTATADQIEREVRQQGGGGADIQHIAAEVAGLVGRIQADEEARQRERDEAREAARLEAAANPYRQRKGKKKRRDQQRVGQKLERRRQEVEGAAEVAGGWDDIDGEGEGDWEEWEGEDEREDWRD